MDVGDPSLGVNRHAMVQTIPGLINKLTTKHIPSPLIDVDTNDTATRADRCKQQPGVKHTWKRSTTYHAPAHAIPALGPVRRAAHHTTTTIPPLGPVRRTRSHNPRPAPGHHPPALYGSLAALVRHRGACERREGCGRVRRGGGRANRRVC